MVGDDSREIDILVPLLDCLEDNPELGVVLRLECFQPAGEFTMSCEKFRLLYQAEVVIFDQALSSEH